MVVYVFESLRTTVGSTSDFVCICGIAINLVELEAIELACVAGVNKLQAVHQEMFASWLDCGTK